MCNNIFVILFNRERTFILSEDAKRKTIASVQEHNENGMAMVTIAVWRRGIRENGVFLPPRMQKTILTMSRIKELYLSINKIEEAIAQNTLYRETLGGRYTVSVDCYNVSLTQFIEVENGNDKNIVASNNYGDGVHLNHSEWNSFKSIVFPYMERRYRLEQFQSCRQTCLLQNNQAGIYMCDECNPDIDDVYDIYV